MSVADPQRRLVGRTAPTLGLFATRLQADLRSIGLALRLMPLALRHRRVLRLVLALGVSYPPGRAHAIARSHGDEIFGETPLHSAWRILEDAGVRPGQTLVELGCGPGRLSLLGGVAFGLRCEGIEQVFAFVLRGNRLARRLGLPVVFRHADLRSWTPGLADWVYVAGTGFPASLRLALAQRLDGSASQVVSVSAPLDIPSHTTLMLGSYRYLWGKDRVFLEVPRASLSRAGSGRVRADGPPA